MGKSIITFSPNCPAPRASIGYGQLRGYSNDHGNDSNDWQRRHNDVSESDVMVTTTTTATSDEMTRRQIFDTTLTDTYRETVRHTDRQTDSDYS